MTQITKAISYLLQQANQAAERGGVTRSIAIFFLAALVLPYGGRAEEDGPEDAGLPALDVVKVEDFEPSGDGRAPQWEKAEWQLLGRVGSGRLNYETRAKVLYSKTGIYFLVDCEDPKITCTLTNDFADLYNEDVVEVFLWPDEKQNVYLEYELSTLGFQLPLLTPNRNGQFSGWLPWQFKRDKSTKARTGVRGGEKAPGAKIERWTAEFCIPFEFIRGLGNVPPAPGTRWRANIYRMDFDENPLSEWAWSRGTGSQFHDFRKFGVFRFK